MTCYTRVRKGQTPALRAVEVKKVITRLEAALTAGRVKIKIGPQGAVVFEGWKPEERDDVTDVCAFRALQNENSWALRQAVAKAEQLSGRKVSQQAVAAGIHSHTDGKTWDKGH
jgi:hypothetical protein